MPPLLQVQDLKIYYSGFRGTRVVKAVDGVSFSLDAGETLGLVGESGSGKSVLCRLAVGLLKPDAGHVTLLDQQVDTLPERRCRPLRARVPYLVLQRDRPVPIWGQATPDEKVTVKFRDQEKTATADKNGKWLVKLDPLQLALGVLIERRYPDVSDAHRTHRPHSSRRFTQSGLVGRRAADARAL